MRPSRRQRQLSAVLTATSYEAKVKQNKDEIEKLKRDIYKQSQLATNDKG